MKSAGRAGKGVKPPVIELKDICRRYKMGEEDVVALDELNLTVKEGEFISFMGPSGCGKTTLLNIIGCIDSPDSGTYKLRGKDVTSLPDRELTRIRLREIGFIFQQFYLIPTLTAAENVELPMKEARIPRTQRTERIKELFDLIELQSHVKHRPNQLSGGQQQRVAIARALANRPAIILADEPTGEIDTPTGEKIMVLLKRLNREDNITILLVTHDEDVARVARKIIRLRDGRVVRG